MPNAGGGADGALAQYESLVSDRNGISTKDTTNTGGAIDTGNGINHMNGFSAENVTNYGNGMS